MSSSKRKQKRKSLSLPSLPPSKKRVKVEGGKEEKIRIKVLTKEGNSSNNPIVVSFPGGMPTSLLSPPSLSSNNNVSFSKDGKLPEFIIRRFPSTNGISKKRKKSRKDTVVTVEDDRCHIIGRDDTCTYEGTLSDLKKKKKNPIQRLCVGIYNKQTGVLEVSLAAGDGNVCALQQFIPEYEEGQNTDLLQSNSERYQALFKEFGSAKRRKALNSQQANRIRVDADSSAINKSNNILSSAFTNQAGMSESNKQALKNLKKSEEERVDGVAQAYMEARKMLLPSWNEDAEKPSLVYDIREMVGAINWDRLSHQTKLMLRNVPDKEKWYDTLTKPSLRFKWHNCIQSHILEKIPSAANAEDLITMAQALNHMITFWHRVGLSSRPLRGDTKSFAKELKIPMDMAAHCLKTFLTHLGGTGWSTRYALGNQDRDRLLVHILLLYLMTHVDEQKGSKKKKEIMKADTMAPIMQQLSKSSLSTDSRTNNKIDIPNLTYNLLREAGCTVEKKRNADEEGDIIVQLKVPLVFPKAPIKRIRRSK
eukprot:CAMPEP_0194147140 /NCGR_PEP_ID=MMETSP0152-20130528/22542_1 /TAXON_ID=1049557 /ORGANISM="Thalassiothrix antarctica, Strain L6-D1" /LENGTH=534 /DNA_ID=CAMNT_0038847833 /DNA_START=24 /DNA_END=1628 /DNA_ORIENTATION=-